MNDYIVKPFDARALVSSSLRHVKPARDRLMRQLDETPAMPVQAALP